MAAIDPGLRPILDAFRDARARLREKHDAGMGGIEHARALSAALDDAVGSLWRAVGGEESGLALVGLGGFGRGELSPHSDVDLMVLHGGSRRAGEVSERLFYALWDAGLTVGHATRTVKESLRLARENIEAETSFLRPRLVAGEEGLFADFVAAALKQTRKRADRFVADVRELMRARHLTGGSATWQLEPNLKEGAGGLRDLHVLGWFDAALPDGLDSLGALSARDREQLDAAADLLLRVRAHLHYRTDRPADVLLLEHQAPTARFLGYGDADRPAEDAFMRDLFAATRAVEHDVSAVAIELTARAHKTQRLPANGEPFAVAGGRVLLVRQPDLTGEPERAIELFVRGAPPGADARRWLEDALAPVEQLPWTDEVRRAFFRLLRAGEPAALEAADHAGVLGRLLPEWESVRCQPQHNVYHRFTVDAHVFHTVAAMVRLAGSDEQLVRDVWEDLGDLDGALLAALLHDIGKGTEEDHSVRGERMALAMLDRMGITDPRRGTVVWLVRNHLLLAETATRRDINDEILVVDLAERIGDVERARMLFLLSVADGVATGPTAWGSWKAALVAELFTKVVHVIERGELVTRDALELARLRTTELRDALAGHDPGVVEAHLAGVPRAYLLAFPSSALIRHFGLLAEQLGPADARAVVTPSGEPGVYEYALVARDRPGLFAKVSGALALNGVRILTAQGFTRADGAAIEVFRCAGGLETEIADARWGRITDDVRHALTGRLSLEVRLAEKRKDYATRPSKGKREPPKVIVDNTVSDFSTVVEVHAADRIGLLYEITSTLADLALDIQVAKIATYAEDVVDVFYVRDLEGQKITEAAHIAEIERALALRLGA
ncbi:MAG TPA: [protein-PII] uridylyltransferase [Actinomycetota bacterium]